jgi:hypothetical protein
MYNKQYRLAGFEKVEKDLVSNAYPVCFVASITHKKPRSSELQRGNCEKPFVYCIYSIC